MPSLFFIGENGTPLEIVAGNATAAELASKIDNVLTKAGKSNKQSSLNLIDAEQKAAAASSSSNNNTVETVMSNINDNNSNPNTNSGVTESIKANSSNDENNVTEDTAKTSLKAGNQDNNEASANIEAKEDNQNKELTAEVPWIVITWSVDIIFCTINLYLLHIFRKNWKEHDS